MRKFLLTFFFFTVLILKQTGVVGQDQPVFSQFYANPYQFNPSYIAHNGYAEANLFYRKQWLGIENAPSVGAINAQMPVGRNVALGITGYSNKTVLLNTNGAMLTFGYKVRMSGQSNLNFGLSGGYGLNNFDLAAVEATNDPALKNVVQRSSFAAAQFGLNYQLGNFNIGFAFPKLLDSKPNSLESFDKLKFDPFKNKFFSASYNINLDDIVVSPMLLYRANDNQSYQSQWEAMVMATWRKTIWVGLSFRDGYGITGTLGVNLKSFRVGYAYEHPTGDIAKASSGSQELYLGARLSKHNREEELAGNDAKRDSLKQIVKNEKAEKKFSEDSIKSLREQQALAAKEPIKENPVVIVTPPVTELPAEQPIVAKPVEQPVVEKPAEQVPVVAPPVVVDKQPIVTAPVVVGKQPVAKPPVEDPKATLPPEKPKMEGYFVVFGAYHNPANADKMLAQMKAEGINGQIIYGEKKNYYYVFTYQSLNRHEALVELGKAKHPKFDGLWIMDAGKEINK